jgi:hypothetical protein
MKIFTQLQKIIAFLMIFILMIEFTGCYSSKILTTSEITPSDTYFIHGDKSTYHVSNVVISDEILSGKMVSATNKKDKTAKNHMYISSDLAIKIKNDTLSVPVFNITKIEQKIPDPKKTKILAAVLIAGGCGITVGLTILIVNGINSTANTAGNTAAGIGDMLNYCFNSY